MSSVTTIAPFSSAVVRAMKRLYPKELADNSWDNTGLLLESPFVPSRPLSNTVLLTIDLTKAVADEAITRQSSIIIAYHPIIFRGLKSLTLKDTQQQTLLRLASAGISVYSPHTAVDAAPGGLGDWLADIVTGTKTNSFETSPESSVTSPTTSKSEEDPFIENNSSLQPAFKLHYQTSSANLSLASVSSPMKDIPHTRRSIVPQSPALDSHPGAGMGRIVTFEHSQPLATVLDRIGKAMNNPKGFPIAIPQNASISDFSIKSVGICAGSGGSLLAGLDVDLLFTGEMSHHEALAAIEKGQVVVSLFHSNSERGFLSDVLRGQLEVTVQEEWEKVREEESGKEELKEALEEEDFEVLVSEVDRDPYGIVVLNAD